MAKKLKHVEQIHNSGCFIACVAMLLNKSYNQALKLIHPKKYHRYVDNRWKRVGLEPEKAIKKLPRLGLKVTRTNINRIRKLEKNALILVRWNYDPTLLHGLVYDHKRKTILDPGDNNLSRKQIENQIDQILYVE